MPGVNVEIDKVSKNYDARGKSVQALSEVSLQCGTGEFTVVVGPSGCGKSTLLLMVAGLLPPSVGSISIDGRRVTGPYTNLGIAFQDAVLLDWRTALQNVQLQGQVRKLPPRYVLNRAKDLMAQVGLEGFEDRYPFELSGGMRQRVSLCRALLADPPLLLMDEPFGAIDALTRDQLNLDLQELWISAPKTVLFVTHSVTEAVFLADRVVVMSPRPGRIEEIIDIGLPRPRTLDLRETPPFGRYTRLIREVFASFGVLRNEVTKTLGGSADASPAELSHNKGMS